ncbi:NAD(P)H-dependent oxidoreductase [Haloplasma contractile]|uniref:NADPH-dependent FMN reductase protein n=1 Tax=Haloplasma contractile SSD-17B TaxID=1033810 RepID=U2FMR7_9MOLU|nr:NAD(P)H-dependent oxidoreductase [Haloplasma contractile]ERJ12439.1 NADPH-dependent FMN reductase protein [Haloplasma contractile SSD-17B]
MNITCISASNTKLMGGNSASTKVCELVKNMITDDCNRTNLSIDVVPLMSYDLRPCDLCGHCGEDSKCIYNDGFNLLFQKIIKSDLIFLVVPFYSVIPSKLTILFEKLNEVLYCNWVNDHQYVPPFKDIPIGIIGHGGMPQGDKVLNYYHEHLISPVARTLKSLSFNVLPHNEEFPNGIAFGLENEHSIKVDIPDNLKLPEIVHNYEMIKDTIQPFVKQVIQDTIK